MSKFKFNPLTGDFNVVPDSGTLIQKLNPVTGDFNLTKEAGKYKQVLCYLSGEFNLRPAVTQVIVHGVGSVQLTNAVENGLLSLKAYGGTEQRNDISCAQGPAPVGYHVPLNTEWQAVYNIWTALGGGSSDGANFGIALKLPFAGNRGCSSAGVYDQGTIAYYWSSTAYSAGSAYYLFFYSAGLNPQNGSRRSSGFSVRCFKNSPTVPTSSWTKLYGTSIEAGGIFWSSTDGLISLSSDGQTWVTIADKNLGATTVWNSEDTLSEANCGKYYQRGNNYGFAWTGTVTTSSTQVDASAYGPGNYYSSSTFITRSYSPYRWDTTDNRNLWGGVSISATDPTPTAPMDIVSNNGVLKARHQSGLPTGYTLLDYILSGGSNYIDTGIKLTNEDVVEMQYLQTKDKGAIYGEYNNGTSNMSTTLYGNGAFYFYAYNAGGTATIVGNYDTNVHTVVHNFVDGYIDFDGVRTNFDLPNPNTFTNIFNCPIFGRSNGSSIGYFSKTQLYYFRIRRNGTLILDLIPAKDSDNNVGMYDRVSGTLFTESGSGSFTAGNTVSDPMTVYADGTTETISSTLSTATAEMLLKVGDYVDEQEILSGNITRKVGVLVLDGTEDGWVKQNNSFRFSIDRKIVNRDAMFCSHFVYDLGSTASIIDGGFGCSAVTTNTYFRNDNLITVEDWKQWLINQYNAGTPVIVLYPLETPTTESVAGQTLSIPAGDSTIGITQASLDNLELEAVYEQEA